MQLPEFLHLVDGKEIRIVGHRIGLHHVVKTYNEGYSAEMIAATFPTLALSTIYRVLAFYLDNEAEVDAHVAEHEREMDRLEAEHRRPLPSLAQLRERLKSMQKAPRKT